MPHASSLFLHAPLSATVNAQKATPASFSQGDATRFGATAYAAPAVVPSGIPLDKVVNRVLPSPRQQLATAMPPALPAGVTLAYQATSPAGYPLAMYVLANGHRVLLENRPNTDVVSIRTFIKTGSINENPIFQSPAYQDTGSPSGIAHLDEHCHFLTTEHFPRPYSWTEKVADYGSDFNASTGMEIIQHELLCNKEDLPSMVAMHGEAVLRPYYQADLISKEKTNVINEIGERSRPAFAKIHNRLMQLMFDRPDFQTHGRIDDINNTTVGDLHAFQRRWYRPSNMVTAMAGNMDVNKTLSLLNRQFGQSPPDATPVKGQQLTLTLPTDKPRHAVMQLPDLVQPLVLVGFPAPGRVSAKDRMAMTFLHILLGVGPSSVLQSTLKTEARLVTDVQVSYDPSQQTGCLEIALDALPGQEMNALNMLLKQLRQLATTPLTPEKLTELKGRITHSFNAAIEQADVSTMSLGEEASYQSLGYFLNFAKLANSMTAADIQRVASQYLASRQYATVLAYPPSSSGAE
jgi:zinc protease